MRRFFSFVGLLTFAFALAGCSLPGAGSSTASSVWKSGDAGTTFAAKNTVGPKNRLTTAEVLTFIQDPQVPDIFYIGTKENGIFKTTSGGDDWTQLTFPPTRVYGLTIDPTNHDRLYATGVYNGVGKIYRSDDGGGKWDPVYTEPGSGTVLTALAEGRDNPNILFVGTTAGVLVKTSDGGSTWVNLKRADGPILQILLESGNSEIITMLVQGKGILRSTDGGSNWETFAIVGGGFGAPTTPSNSGFGSSAATPVETPRDALSLVADPTQTNVFYLGTSSGLFRSTDNAKTWGAINIIASSKKFPIHAIAVNPKNKNEIVYVSGATFYKTIDGGANWSTLDISLTSPAGLILYDKNDASKIYIGTRKF